MLLAAVVAIHLGGPGLGTLFLQPLVDDTEIPRVPILGPPDFTEDLLGHLAHEEWAVDHTSRFDGEVEVFVSEGGDKATFVVSGRGGRLGHGREVDSGDGEVDLQREK